MRLLFLTALVVACVSIPTAVLADAKSMRYAKWFVASGCDWSRLVNPTGRRAAPTPPKAAMSPHLRETVWKPAGCRLGR